DVQVHVMRLVAIFRPPDGLQDAVERCRAPGMLDQVLEQAGLGWPQPRALPVDDDLQFGPVDLKPLVYYSYVASRLARRGAPQHCLDPRCQLRWAERLGHVIVGT